MLEKTLKTPCPSCGDRCIEALLVGCEVAKLVAKLLVGCEVAKLVGCEVVSLFCLC